MGLTQVNSEGIKDGEIKDADVNASAAIAGSKLAAATTSAAGSMSAADKTKLDGVATSATANPSAPALTGSTNNQVTTVTGANAIQGEANLTFDGSTLSVSAESEYQLVVKDSNTTGNGAEAAIAFKDSADATLGLIGPNEWANGNFKVNNSTSGGSISFETHDGTSVAQRASISSSGHFTIDDGNLVIGTGGKGIDFSATSHNAGMTSELLHSYEEGIFTATMTPQSGTITFKSAYNQMCYTKIGRLVTITGRLDVDSVSSPSGEIYINLPFTVGNNADLSNSCAPSLFVYNATSGPAGEWLGWSDNNQNVLYFRQGNTNTPPNGGNLVQANTEFRITFTYMAAD